MRGTLRPLALAEPLVGFVRDCHGIQLLAAFNLSDAPALLGLDDYSRVRPCAASGFAAEMIDQGAIMAPYGVFFAEVAPASEWREEAALAFA